MAKTATSPGVDSLAKRARHPPQQGVSTRQLRRRHAKQKRTRVDCVPAKRPRNNNNRPKKKPRKTPVQKYPIGTKVRKEFPSHDWFNGSLMGFSKKNGYKILYDDGDSEEIGEKEMDSIVANYNSHIASSSPLSSHLPSATAATTHARAPVMQSLQVVTTTASTTNPSRSLQDFFSLPPCFTSATLQEGGAHNELVVLTPSGVVKISSPSTVVVVSSGGTNLAHSEMSQHPRNNNTNSDPDGNCNRDQLENNRCAEPTTATNPSIVRQRYPVGTKVRKAFPGHGWFNGYVVEFDEVYGYKILYDDGDMEEIGEKELEAIVVGKKPRNALVTGASANQKSPRRQKVSAASEEHAAKAPSAPVFNNAEPVAPSASTAFVGNHSATNSSVSESLVATYSPELESSPTADNGTKSFVLTYPSGTKVRKHFPGFGWYNGKITEFDETYGYIIKYDDGDAEGIDDEAELDVLVQNYIEYESCIPVGSSPSDGASASQQEQEPSISPTLAIDSFSGDVPASPSAPSPLSRTPDAISS